MSRALDNRDDRDGVALAEPPVVGSLELRAFGPRLVRRPRLVEHILGAVDHPVVLLTAPAGYGKTTVLSEWEADDERPFVRLTLDDADNDPAALLASVIEALELIEPVSPEVSAALSAPEPSISGIVLPRLGRSLAGRERPFVLVLDDVHVLEARESLESLTAIAGHLPPGSQLALASRVKPPLPLGRMRTHRKLVELHQGELVMTRAEAGELLEGMGLSLDPADLDTVVTRTEGWPAALYLAGLALLEERDTGRAIAEFAGDDRVVVDYLRDEFLSKRPPDMVEFMVRSSVLDVLTGPVCDAVLERSGSAGMLRDLARSNTLIVPLDRRDHSYRYHALFAEMLHSELDRLEPEIARELDRRASDWYAEREDYDRAVSHAIAARDVVRAGALLWVSIPLYMTRGRNATIRRWLGAFSDEQIAGCPPLALTTAQSFLASGQGAHADHWTSVAEAGLEHTVPAELRPAIEAGILATRAQLARDGVVRMAEHARRAAALLPDDSPWHSVCSWVEGVASHLSGDRKEARRKLEDGARRGVVGAPIVEVLCLVQLSLLAIDEGARDEATELATRARAQVERSGLTDYESVALPFAVSALIQALNGRVEAAASDARRSTRLLELLADFPPWYEAETQVVLARAQLRLDDVEAARRLLVRASRALQRTPDATALRDWLQGTWAAIDSSLAGVAGERWELTPAELRVLQFLPTHLSFREIAERLYVSTNTVKTQARAVYRKLDVSSRAEAVECGQQAGLLDPERPSPEVD